MSFVLALVPFLPPPPTRTTTITQSWTRFGPGWLSMEPIVIALLHPGMLLVWCGVVYALWWLHAYLITNKVTILRNHDVATILSITQRSTILTIVTFLLFYGNVFCRWWALSWWVDLSSFCCTQVKVMRDPQHSETATTMSGEKNTLFVRDEEEDSVLVERGDFIWLTDALLLFLLVSSLLVV